MKLRNLFVSLFLASCLTFNASIEAVTWDFPTESIANDTNSITTPKIAMDSAGNAIAVWVSNSSTVHAATKPATQTTWNSPVTLGSASSPTIELGIDAGGNATATWNGSGSVIQSANKPFNAAWSSAVTIASSTTAVLDQFVNQAGDVMVTYYSQMSPTSFSVNSVFKGATQTSWNSPETIAPFSIVPGGATVVLDSTGNAMVVISDSLTTLFTADCPKLGTWQNQALLSSSHSPLNTISPKLAIDASDIATVIWVETYGFGPRTVQSSTKTFGNSWSTSLTIFSNTGTNALSQPSLAADPTGNLTAIWITNGGTSQTIDASTKAVGGSWQTAQAISSSFDSFQYCKTVMDPAGNAIAIWVGTNSGLGTVSKVQAAQKPFNLPWQTAQTLSGLINTNKVPDIAVDGMGNALAVWSYTTSFPTTYHLVSLFGAH